MQISMIVVLTDGSKEVSTFDEEDIKEQGVSIGDAIGAAFDQEIVLSETAQISFIITK